MSRAPASSLSLSPVFLLIVGFVLGFFSAFTICTVELHMQPADRILESQAASKLSIRQNAPATWTMAVERLRIRPGYWETPRSVRGFDCGWSGDVYYCKELE